MFEIKTKWNYLVKDISLNKRNYSFRIVALILGLYIFTLGITIGSQTAVGVSMIDFTIFSGLFSSEGLMETQGTTIVPGTIKVQDSPYALYCGLLYVGMSIVSLIFMSIWVAKDYKTTRNKMLFVMMGLAVVGDIIIILGIPLLIEMNLLYIPGAAIANAAPGIRVYIFMLAFACYALGIALWVYASLLSGPYNSICTNFLKVTGIKSYSVGRTAMNLLILAPGFIVIIIMGLTGTPWSDIGNFLVVNISFGTVFYVFVLGIVVTAWGKLIRKILIVKPHVSPDEPKQTELNLSE
ncbi:SPE_1075/MLC_0560 family membrane protein [Spiroplasma endosymbiont of Othius punctulatus]|uniref:SPE_1075/MLC_0560 family membrane protein n=1 Tax=Spiroplasma endosymbiont of Othius punctulatus TaxID=3066289 RepID=UPI0030D4B378